MSIFIKKSKLRVKNEDGTSYTGVMNAIAEESTEELIKQIETKGKKTLESIPEDYTVLEENVDKLKEDKVDKPSANDNNKIPRAKDGEVEWVEAGQPTDEQTNNAVTDWLNEHPEATTTVENHSLDINKMVIGTLSYITPEMFGANGDGVVDDTQAFQHMLSASCKTWKLEGGKKYRLHSLEIVERLNIEGNNATLYFYDDKGIVINLPIEDSGFYGKIENLIIEGNNTNNSIGINILKGSQFYLKDCVIKNFHTGIKYSNNAKETFISKCRISNCNIGIYSNGSDVEVSYITMRNCKTALYITAPSNFHNVHAWLSDNFEDSIFADCYADSYFYNCYPDTYQYGFFIRELKYILINDVSCLRNINYWNDNLAQYLIFSESSDCLIHTAINGGWYIGETTHNYYLTNFNVDECKFLECRGLDFSRYIKNANIQRLSSLSLEKGSVIRNSNNIIINNGMCISISATIEFVGNGTSTQKIASVPVNIAPVKKIIIPCGIADGDGATYDAFRETCSCIIDVNGSITLRSKNAFNGTKYAGIYATFIGKKISYLS